MEYFKENKEGEAPNLPYSTPNEDVPIVFLLWNVFFSDGLADYVESNKERKREYE